MWQGCVVFCNLSLSSFIGHKNNAIICVKQNVGFINGSDD